MKVKDMVREMLEDKVNEIFASVQEATDVQHGDVAPWDLLTLNERMESLVDIITEISEWQYRMDIINTK